MDVEWKVQVDIIIIQDIHSRWKRIIKNKDIKAEEILKLTRQFLSVMEKMKDYMLEPNYLMLSEKYIFEKDENYFFCFFPENEKTWQVSYHELTEYFVKKVDYQDPESIQLACMLHKETLKRNL